MAKKEKPPTLNNVAELAGVSRATASRALAGYGRISPETVAVVQAAASKIGYRPNDVARAMRAGRTRTIGLVVIADFTNAFFDRATKAIIDAAKLSGYETLVSHTDERVENEKQAIRTLVQKRVDGIILVPASDVDHGHLNSSELGNTPVVLIDRRLEGSDLSSVTTGDFDGAVEAVDYAFERGHRDMAFLVAVPGLIGSTEIQPLIPISTVLDRTNGFLKGISSHGLQARMVFCEDSQVAAETAVEKLLEKNPPSIIITSNNDMLLAVLRVAGKRKVAIGIDLSIISFDDSPWAAAMSPAITVISRPVDDLGRIAVDSLLNLIEKKGAVSDVVLPTLLIERDSVRNLS